MKTTLYQVLGVEAQAGAPAIAAAYRERIDAAERGVEDPATLGLIRQAFEVLSDPARRAAYDASLVHTASRAANSTYHPMPASSSVGAGIWVALAALLLAAIGAVAWWVVQRPAVKPVPRPVVPAVAESKAPAPSSAPSSAPIPTAAPAAPARPTPPVTQADPGPRNAVPPDPGATAEGANAAGSPPMASVAVQPAPAVAAPVGSAETVFADVSPSVARVNVLDASDRNIGNGSAVVIEPGIVLTSCHVATAGAKLTVKLGELVLPATVHLADEEFDLCQLRVPGVRAPPVRIGSVQSLRTGQKVFAIGAPAGLELTISEGIVSSLRKVDEGTVIQTTAPISPGSSGGGLFEASGRLVGIMTFQHRFGQNLNFALPADWIGQMRARPASAGGWRAAAVGDRASSQIVGQWLCRDWISGRTGRYTFGADGRVTIAMLDFPELTLNYGVSGKSLQFFDSQKAIVLELGELTAKRLIFKGRDRNIACER